jgi:hypothetical protein
MEVAALVGRVRRRLLRVDLAWSIAAGMAALAGVAAIGAAVPEARSGAIAVGAIAAVAAVAHGYWRSRARWTPLAAAGALEASVGGLDNLIVTAVSLDLAPERGSRAIREEVARQATERAALVSAETVVPASRAATIALLSTLGAALVLWGAYTRPIVREPSGGTSPALTGFRGVRLTIAPPDYLERAAATIENPDFAEVPAGSRVRIEAESSHPLVWLSDAGGESRIFARAGGTGPFSIDWLAEESRAVVIATGEAQGDARDSRLLTVTVIPDQAPTVRIVSPGKDLAFETPSGIVDIEIEAADGERLEELDLRFVRMSGSGEAFEFDEGRVPLTISRTDATSWRARARWSLAALSLEDGDALVYRAVVRDSNPRGQPVASESFTIDIGKRLEFAGAGFAVPDEDRRYAISQQMVIVKTEQLQAARSKYGPEEWAAETRGLAVEQRMVRSEVVFLSGGEVEDELEEAAHSHELQEGRLENAGRAEMIRAISEMSRAEARLNAGDTQGALVFERLALQALQRAFDRRRYFLRTLPERSRIDLSRRLSGDRSDAGSSTRRPAEPDADLLAEERALMQELSRVAAADNAGTSLVAARLASLDPGSVEWRRLAAALTAASTPDERRAAAADAMAALARRARSRLAPSNGPAVPEAGSIDGWFADEMRRGTRQR